MSAPLLTDEQMRALKRQIDMAPKRWPFALANELEYARAIESAVRAPLLAEIERLTASLKAANDQAEHFEREWYLRGDEIERLTAERDAARAELEAAKTADGLREPMNGTDWHVQWWNESARVMLPTGSRINNITSFRNGTLILTIKRAAIDAARSAT